MAALARSVLVGLSGGVDSAVAVYLLQRNGYDVTGIMMTVYGGQGGAPGNACYGPGEEEDVARAAAVADHLGIGFQVINCVADYEAHVLGYFRQAYLSGHTPNPCVRCNPVMKFGLLPQKARLMGLDGRHFATGHYVRKQFSSDHGRWMLLRGADPGRDQSYFLYRLSAQQIETALFPLGELRKDTVRRIAEEAGLPVHAAPDSQDFYAGDYRELLPVAPREGLFVDDHGTILGRHGGHWNFTPGQRRGLGISHDHPLYVLRVDPDRNLVVVGNREATFCTGSRSTKLPCESGRRRTSSLDQPVVRTSARISLTARGWLAVRLSMGGNLNLNSALSVGSNIPDCHELAGKPEICELLCCSVCGCCIRLALPVSCPDSSC